MKLCLNCDQSYAGDSKTCPHCDHSPPEEAGFPLFAPELNQANIGFTQSAFELLYAREASSFWFQSRNKIITWAIETYFPGAETFLEVGCGTGFVLSEISSHFDGLHCSGSEIHVAGLGFARMRIPHAPLLQMDARRIPFSDEFDLIGAFDVLEHIREDNLVLEQMHNAVTSKGGILLTVPQHQWLWSKADVEACHERRYSCRQLIEKVTAAGFEVVKTTSFVSLLLPFMAASRLKERVIESQPDGELDLPDGLNSFFQSIMNFEAALIRKGIRFPAGGSLLLVARKRA